MSRTLRRVLVAAVAVALLVPLTFLVMGAAPSKSFVLNSTLAPSKGYSVDAKSNDRILGKLGVPFVGHDPKLRLDLTLSPNLSRADVTGTAAMILDGKAYPVSFENTSTLDKVTDTTGATLYFGYLFGHLKTDQADNPVVLVVAARPDNSQTLATLTIGTFGDEAMVAFGDDFLTPQTLNSIRGQIGK